MKPEDQSPYHDDCLRRFIQQRDARRAAAGLARLHAAAQRRGVECLNTVFEGFEALYRFRCPAGHAWEREGAAALRSPYCVECAEASRMTLDKLHEMAKERGGQCLVGEYRGPSVKTLWSCRYGHRWQASPNAIRRGQWCPECADVARLVVMRSKRRVGFRQTRLDTISDWEESLTIDDLDDARMDV